MTTKKQRDEAAFYAAWLRSDRDLSPGVPIRADMATFLEQLAKPGARRPPVETTLQRYWRRQEKRMPWIRKVMDARRELGAQKLALNAVAREPGAPSFSTLRRWLYEDRGNSRFLPVFDDGTLNVEPEEP